MPRPNDAYREGYEKGKSADAGGALAALTMGMLRDDPGGHFAAGYRDGAAGKPFQTPADTVRKEAADLNPLDDKVAIKTVCPNCGALDWFEWKFLGRLTDPVCGHTWYAGSGTYALMQVRAAFGAGRRFSKYMTSGISGEGAWIAKAMGWFIGTILGIGMRLEFGLLMTPIQAIAGLCQSQKSKGEVISRSIVVGVFVVAVGLTAYVIGQGSPSGLSVQPSVIQSRDQVASSFPPAPGVTPPAVDHPPQQMNSTGPSHSIPSLGATVRAVQFYEAGALMPPKESRTYSNRFATRGTRFIYWEMNLESATHVSGMDFLIEAVWSRADGSVAFRQTTNAHVQPAWTSYWWSNGWGSAGGGTFASGIYSVELFVDGLLVAREAIELYEGDAPPAMYIQAFDGKVSLPLQFFSSEREVPPKGNRTYISRFSGKETSNINWELNLVFPRRDSRVDFAIQEIWMKPDGSIDHQSSLASDVETGWANSYHYDGWGRQGGGYWQQLGTYHVNLYVDNRKIASGSFDIY